MSKPTLKMRRAFNEWFESHDWWHDNTARERLMATFFSLAVQDIHVVDITDAFDEVIGVMRNEYGE